jgi:magnesium transporter
MTPTLVVSMFSMNVRLPMQQHPAAFWLILAAAIVSAVGVFLFWRRKKL